MEKYFYKIDAYSYESSLKAIFMSDIKYTQEEFEKIVFECYEKMCYDIISKDQTSLCFPIIYFNVEFSIFSKEFYELLKNEYGLENIEYNLNGRICFDLTSDKYKNPHNIRLNDTFCNLDIDESCWDENCPKLDGKNKESYRRDCGVAIRKINRLENKSCDNCIIRERKYNECEDKNYCNDWKWNGLN